MNKDYLNKITNADCLGHLTNLEKETMDLFLSDIPYGICLNDWDVLHNNTNSALLGTSPAQQGKSGFKRRGKPINPSPMSRQKIGLYKVVWDEVIYTSTLLSLPLSALPQQPINSFSGQDIFLLPLGCLLLLLH